MLGSIPNSLPILSDLSCNFPVWRFAAVGELTQKYENICKAVDNSLVPVFLNGIFRVNYGTVHIEQQSRKLDNFRLARK